LAQEITARTAPMSRFYHELKRRKVFRVALAYLVAAWVLMQVADVLAPVLELPEWASKLVFFLLLIGFVPALLLAWAFEVTPAGIKRELDETVSTRVVRHKNRNLEHILVAVLALALIGTGAYWYLGRDARWARDEALPLIERHAADGSWEMAFAIAQQVEARLPGDPTLAELWQSFSWLTSIPSNPPGAKVYRRPYREPAAEWELLGETPLYDIRIPRGLSELRLELDGHVPLLRVIGGEASGDDALPVRDRPIASYAQIYPGAFDFDTPESLPEGMVRVPGDTKIFGDERIQMRDFYIDRFEVSNRQFKTFVDAGGYSRQEFWQHEFAMGGETITFEDAMTQFVDTTGRPGPLTWQAGSYPDGTEDHPVAGVSWYEAAAYARFVRRELPTVHHWRTAFAEVMLPWLIETSNLESAGTAAVGRLPSLGWTGTFDMAGNVREWCLNADGEQRIIVGGAWNDEPYYVQESVADGASLPPFDRSPTNGFRLAVTRDEPAVANVVRQAIVREEEEDFGEPVSDEVYAALLRSYQYDKGPLAARIEESEETRYWTRQRITFNAAYGELRNTLYLYLPHAAEPPLQTILYWPTTGALVLSSVEQVNMPLDFALKNGRAVAFPVLDGTFERRQTGFPNWASVAGRDLVIRQMKDMRRSIDYLETRADIDAQSLAFYGFSYGGRLGAIALAVEPRLKIAVLNQAGLQHVSMPETSVVNFLPRVSAPVLQFNGRYDTDFRFETSAKPYFDLLGTAPEDKKHVVEPTGHFVSQATVIGETLNWLDKYLGKVAQ
jgi:predicted esterase